MKIFFATTNEMKLDEGRLVLSKYNIELEQIDEEYLEPADFTQQEIVLTAAKEIAEKTGKTVITEDTGIYLDAFNNFPGPRAKFVYLGIGIEGILRLLEGKPRGAYFLCCIGYCEPGKEPKVFEGRINGKIDTKITPGAPVKGPYDGVFIPEGYDKPFAAIMDVKQKLSHRVRAFEELAKYLS